MSKELSNSSRTDGNMSRWYSPVPEYSEISEEDKALRDKIVAIIAKHTVEMEGYSYYGSNPGIKEDDYDDVADDIMIAFGINAESVKIKD